MAEPPVLQDIRDLTPGWLSACPQLSVAESAITSIDVEQLPDHTSTARVRLGLTPVSRTSLPRQLIFKISCRLPGTARAEALFYSDIVPSMPSAPVPACYHVAFDPETGTTNLLLQDISATHTLLTETQHVPLRQLESMIDTLAAIHGCWWESSRIDQDDFMRPMEWMFIQQATHAEHIHSHCRQFERELLPACFDALGDDVPAAWRRLCEQAIGGWPDLFAERTQEGRSLTLTHYDPHPMNFCLPKGSVDRVLLGDWEGCTRSIGTFDASFLLTVYSTVWPDPQPEHVPSLLRRYHGQLAANGVEEYSWEKCRYDYRLSLIGYLLRTVIWRDPTRMRAGIRLFEEEKCQELLD